MDEQVKDPNKKEKIDLTIDFQNEWTDLMNAVAEDRFAEQVNNFVHTVAEVIFDYASGVSDTYISLRMNDLANSFLSGTYTEELELNDALNVLYDGLKELGVELKFMETDPQKFQFPVKSGLSENAMETLKKTSTEVEVKDNIAILKSNITGNYILFDYNINDFVDDEIYSDIASAESALEDYTEDIGNSALLDLADDLVLDIKDVQAVEEKLAAVSKGNSGYGKIEFDQIIDIARETGVSDADVETIALELGYTVE